MVENKNRWNLRRYGYIFWPVAVCVLFFILWSSLRFYIKEASKDLALIRNWRYFYQKAGNGSTLPAVVDGRALSRPFNPPQRRYHNDVWFRTVVPAEWTGKFLYIDNVDNRVFIFQDRSPLCVQKKPLPSSHRFTGFEWVLCRLHRSRAESELLFHVYSVRRNLGIPGNVYIGEPGKVLRYILARSAVSLVTAFVLSIGIIVVLFYRIFEYREKTFTTFAVLLANLVLYILIRIPVRQVLLTDSGWISLAELTIMFFLPFTFARHWLRVHEKSIRPALWAPMRILVMVNAVIPVAAVALQYFGIRSMQIFQDDLFGVLVIQFAVILVAIRPQGDQRGPYIAHLAGILIVAVSGIADYARVYGYGFVDAEFMPLAMMIYMTILSTFELRKMYELHERLRLSVYGRNRREEDFVSLYQIIADGIHSRNRFDRLETELIIARRIHRQILRPVMPTLEYLRLKTYFEPAGHIGGDVYDVSRISGTETGLFVADVVGHGIPAALTASMVKMAYQSLARSFRNPDQLMRKLNTRITRLLKEGFVTAQFVYIDSRSRCLSLANGGHQPAILWKRSEEMLLTLRPSGIALGLGRDMEYPLCRQGYETGDILLMFTDGLVEMDADGRQAILSEMDRLRDLLREFCPFGLEKAATEIRESYIGSKINGTQREQWDDITWLMAEFIS